MKLGPSKGFVLPTTLIMLLVCTILLGAVIGYVSNATRQTSILAGNSVCRLAAQSALEDAKTTIYNAFFSYSGGSMVKVGLMTGQSFDWFENVSDHRTIGKSKTATLPAMTNINGCAVKPRIAVVNHPSGAAYAIVTLRATASLTNANHTVSTSTIEETVRFGLGRSRVFDHAYFVNNYGWFQGTGCTANGDVRANGDMYLDSGCTINGNVYAAKNDELDVDGSISNTGLMQNRNTYWSSCGTTARPTSPTSAGGATWSGGYEAPVSVTSSALTSRLHAYESEGLTMPYISDLDEYVTYAKEQGGTISQGGTVLVNAYYDGVGPSGDTTLADKGSILLVGTASNPIVINGPVVVASDVLISGYVTGKGVIYSGRNIHILNNVTYVNPPSWSHPDTTPDATKVKNAAADMLGLAAKGNIVLGNYTDSSWHSAVDQYLYTAPYVQKYACDASDASIGYPSTFGGDYTALDGGSMVATTTTTLDTYHYETVYTRWGGSYQNKVYDTTTTQVNSPKRHYYDSVVDSTVISKYASSSISHIDGVLYNNHGIFGKIGNCVINGALVCRNEAMIYSNKLRINWDIRLDSGSSEGSSFNIDLPMDASRPPTTLDWREVPASLNNY